MAKSKFDYWFDPTNKILFIEDLYEKYFSVITNLRTITNNIETVLERIIDDSGKELSEYKIMYKDTDGVWDGLIYDNGNVLFYSLNETELENAIIKIKIKHNEFTS